jgi:hypothetical protein
LGSTGRRKTRLKLSSPGCRVTEDYLSQIERGLKTPTLPTTVAWDDGYREDFSEVEEF